uniref:Uncharacterized protein n=1 Tax=Rhizophora mucronata TaxID=61149 RepID=A0A2P2JE13_RHIMU
MIIFFFFFGVFRFLFLLAFFKRFVLSYFVPNRDEGTGFGGAG